MPPGAVISGRRRAGILAHITSLPGAGAQGSLGAEAYRFIDFLAQTGCSVWQTLPLNPVDASGSPYQSASVFAGNSALLPEWMAVAASDEGYAEFRRTHAYWLEDYALYCALQSEQHHQPWYLWPAALRDRDAQALAHARARLAQPLEMVRQAQYAFFSAWKRLRRYAHLVGVYLFGDMPMFAAHNSADVWSRRELFCVDEYGRMTETAGTPPDAFAVRGQSWGCPVYRWEALARDGFRWWRERLATQAELFDVLRLDHFRGFEATWHIPAEAPSAVEGRWVPVPGRELFAALRQAPLPALLVAEDLGYITPAVDALRRDLNLPGMRVLQFAFSGERYNPHLPHNHAPGDVVYTGTHDTDTTLGWWQKLDAESRGRALEYLDQPGDPMPWPLMHAALASVCWLAMLPLQDCLGLDSGARMNTPGTSQGNWSWRCPPGVLDVELARKLRALLKLYGREG